MPRYYEILQHNRNIVSLYGRKATWVWQEHSCSFIWTPQKVQNNGTPSFPSTIVYQASFGDGQTIAIVIRKGDVCAWFRIFKTSIYYVSFYAKINIHYWIDVSDYCFSSRNLKSEFVGRNSAFEVHVNIGIKGRLKTVNGHRTIIQFDLDLNVSVTRILI